MIKPNFFIIGAAKGGTTAIHNYLDQHPQIYMSANKEPHFLTFLGQDYQDFVGPGIHYWQKQIVDNIDDYRDLFETVNQEKAIGESSVYNLYYPQACQHIQEYCPQAKLIAILRHPAARAFSHHTYLLQYEREPLTNFAEAIQAETERINQNWGPGWHYIQAGFYFQQLKRYFDIFEQEQIKVVIYDDFASNSTQVLQDIFQFLEVDTQFIPDLERKYNKSGLPKNPLLHQVLTKHNPQLKSLVKTLVPQQVYNQIKSTKQELVASNSYKPKLSTEMRQHLIDIYREDIINLQSLINRDLSYWLK